MCGRFTVSVDIEEVEQFLKENFDINDLPNDFIIPRYNIAPGQDIISIINDGGKNRVGSLNWGFVPHFTKNEKQTFKIINAKSETLATKPSFKDSFINKRCLIIADGFYEWKKVNKKKIPFYIKLKNKKMFTFAGLWSSYKRDDGSKHYSCTIITTKANDLFQPIHERMPVIMTKVAERIWLNPNIKDIKMLSTLLNPFPIEKMDYYQVSEIVNNSRNETPQCIEKALK